MRTSIENGTQIIALLDHFCKISPEDMDASFDKFHGDSPKICAFFRANVFSTKYVGCRVL
jgi:hypothetical protein